MNFFSCLNHWRLPGLVATGAFLCLLGASHSASGASYSVDPSVSTFAVITHRGGFASGLSHDHLVVADLKAAVCTINALPEALLAGRFSLQIPTKSLLVDESERKEQLGKRLQELAVLNEKFQDLSPEDRQKVRGEMLGAEQLDADKFPQIEAVVTGLSKHADKRGAVSFDYQATVRLTLHGKTLTKTVPANIEVHGSQLQVEALGQANLTEFGIEPISLLLGAIQVLDGFDIYVKFVAKAES